MSTTTTTSTSKPLPLLLYPERQRPLRIIQVGAGGTGARIAIALIKLLENRDTYHIFDHDIVERKNIFRQHFCESDIGMPKAEVLARRLQVGSATTVRVANYRKMFESSDINNTARRTDEEAYPGGTILIGAVDNVKARQALRAASRRMDGPWALIDTGNEMSGGQVTLDCVWRFHLEPTQSDEAWWSTFYGSEIFPRLYQEEAPAAPNAAPACAIRFDTQTVAANHMAAALAINIVSWFLDGSAVSNAGSYFSTSGSCRTLMLSGHRDSIVVNR